MKQVTDFLWGEEAFDCVAPEVSQRWVVEVGLNQGALLQKDLLNGSQKPDLLGVVVVGLNMSLKAALHHLWHRHFSWPLLLAVPPVLVMTSLQIHLYDYYKESFLLRTRLDWNGIPERIADVEERIERLNREGAPWVYRRAMHLYLSLVVGQTRLIRLTDPDGSREQSSFRVTPRSVAEYRQFNLGPLRLWTALSLAPHSYLFAISGMFDRLDVYVWARLVVGGVLSVVVLVWQRRASTRTMAALAAAGSAPLPPGGLRAESSGVA